MQSTALKCKDFAIRPKSTNVNNKMLDIACIEAIEEKPRKFYHLNWSLTGE